MVGCAALVAQAKDAIPAAAAAVPSVAEAISQEVRVVFEKCQKAIVRIEGTDFHGTLSGTGFFIDPNGTILTSYTVGGEAREIVVMDGDRKLPARRLTGDARSGIALLKVDAETPFLSLGKSRDLAVASPVVAVGYALDLPIAPSFGTVAGLDIKCGDRYFATAHLRVNVPVQRGQGGAPLLNLRGEVVGILISSIDAGSAAYALPVEAAEKIRRDFVRFGEARPGWMGIGVRPGATTVDGSNAQVDEIFADAPGEKAGLEKDDIIVQIGERKVASPDDVRDAAFFTTAEDELTIKVWRGGSEVALKVTPTDHPSRAHAGEPQGPQTKGIGIGIPLSMPLPAPLNER